MEVLRITKSQARTIILSHQGLWNRYEFKSKQGILEYIKRVGCIQYDPLNIVGRNAELVLQSRILDFRTNLLEELLYKDRKLVDGLDKVMSIYPMEDWSYFRSRRDAAFKRYGVDSGVIAPFLPLIREEIHKRAPLSSIDLDLKQVVDWAWSPTRVSRAALESMHLWGELIIHHKVGTRKLYDFAKKYIPEGILNAEDPNENIEQFYQWYLLRRIGAIGLLWNKASDAWIGIPGLRSKERNEAFIKLLNTEKIIEVNVEDIKYPLYIRSQDVEAARKVMSTKLNSPRASIIAPLDNMLWDRKLIKELFNFDYRWEVYKPVEQREYGYYVLPVLYGDKFIARFEPGRDVKNRIMFIKNWWWEPGIKKTEKMITAIQECLNNFKCIINVDKIVSEESFNL